MRGIGEAGGDDRRTADRQQRLLQQSNEKKPAADRQVVGGKPPSGGARELRQHLLRVEDWSGEQRGKEHNEQRIITDFRRRRVAPACSSRQPIWVKVKKLSPSGGTASGPRYLNHPSSARFSATPSAAHLPARAEPCIARSSTKLPPTGQRPAAEETPVPRRRKIPATRAISQDFAQTGPEPANGA